MSCRIMHLMTRQQHAMHAVEWTEEQLTVHLMSQWAADALSQAGP